MNKKEFYIGWMPQAPERISATLRLFLLFLGTLVISACILVSLSQKKFSTASFEYGQLTQLKGIYQQFPVPALKISSPPDAMGRVTYITIPLVGYGKFGAEGILDFFQKERQTNFDKMELTLKGTLLYSDGKTLLQIDRHDNPIVKINPADPKNESPPSVVDLGTLSLEGEILDPKCYFGVMKPGQGKPHRDCATRCILGGISPVLHIQNQKGESTYCLIVGADGKKINNQLQDYVADPIRLVSQARKVDDWIILYVNPENDITRISELSWVKKEDVLSCLVW